ncbi:uncharacterized protein BX664DRAFT_185671 [Halteromyces radiatus]|uniref:uncharacterized protein n=1 Tax=Halteromyces radiatus TaxID=101107 RepID=UPI00221FF8AC|nr:uncharacterized protein BX664DRAFT_185671 [Halteromyces radiatus]KAI8082903.1 hypothetical protein BX664DRAFT_185671 [Halteromyces radiatus]
MKQTSQAAPDFTELLKHARDLVMVNKQFCQKLQKFAGNAQAAQELGVTLMQWVDDMEIPYANYSRSFIPNLNQRQDILANRSIDQLLKDLSQSASYDISLESLFNAPIQQLKYYHGLYNRLLESADPSRSDFQHLTKATRSLETILSLSQKSVSSKSGLPVLPPPIRTQPNDTTSLSNKVAKKKKSMIRQEDFFSYYTETGEVSPLESSEDEDDFDGYDSTLQTKIHDKATDDELSTIQPRTVKIVNTTLPDPKIATTTAAAAAAGGSTASASAVKKDTSAQVQMTFIQPATAKMDHIDTVSVNKQQQQQQQQQQAVDVKTTSRSDTSNNTSHVDTVRAALATPPSQRTLSPSPGDSPRPVSPRAVQVQQAVTPVAAMQAVSQKTHDYFSSSPNNITSSAKPLPSPKEQNDTGFFEHSTSSTTPVTLPRTSSKRGTAQNVDPTARSNQRSNPPAKSMNSQPPVITRPFAPVQNPGVQPTNGGQPRPMMNNMYNQAPPPQHHQGYSHQPIPLLRSSSHNSTEQQGYGMHSMPPRMNSNGPHPVPSRSTGTTTSMHHYQQQRPPLPPQQISARPPPMHSPTYQQPRTPPPTDDQQNGVRQVLYSNNQCEVFHWKDQSWYAVDGQCTLQVRLTYGGRSCLAVQLQPSGQLYLNAWILPSMSLSQPSATDVSVSVTMMARQENYLVHFRHPADASNLFAMLQRMHHESSQSSTPSPTHHQKPRMARQDTVAVELRDDTPSVEDVPQTLKPVFQCKCKLFVQSETSKWNPMGSTAMRISQQLPSQKMHIYIEDDKNKLISSIVRSGNVERLTNKRITFLLTNEQDKSSVVYLIQVKDEQTGNKLYDYLKTQNAAQGW